MPPVRLSQHAPALFHHCLLPLLLPATPLKKAPLAAPVQPVSPEMAAMPAPAAVVMGAPLIVLCCCWVAVRNCRFITITFFTRIANRPDPFH
jgi:hypothetical protein